MTHSISLGFELDQVNLHIDKILPSKLVPHYVKKSKKYNQILVSIKEVGLVEPLIVFPQDRELGQFTLLDGHLRFEVLKAEGKTEITCMVAKDDEAFTYNKRISRLSPVQEHYMILRAIEKGVSEKRIASALGVNISGIKNKRKLLDGITQEVVEMLKDRHFPDATINVIRKMKKPRQVEAVELMIAANNFTVAYIGALLMATPEEQLRGSKAKKTMKAIPEKERLLMEEEMKNLSRDMKVVEEDYGVNIVRLVVANGYIAKLLENENIAHFLRKNYYELHTQLGDLSKIISQETGLYY